MYSTVATDCIHMGYAVCIFGFPYLQSTRVKRCTPVLRFAYLALPKGEGRWCTYIKLFCCFWMKVRHSFDVGQLHEVKRYLPCGLCPIWLLMKVIWIIQSAVSHAHMASSSLSVMLLVVKILHVFVYFYPWTICLSFLSSSPFKQECIYELK